MAEWSKATDSRSVLCGGVGSNPTECKTIIIILKKKMLIAF